MPEHTLGAYALGAGFGAHVVEPDVVLTRDHVAICLHDIYLERVTDVADRFPGRHRGDGRYYAIDFTLEELRRLTVGSLGGIATLGEMLQLVQRVSGELGRVVGVAPEAKKPGFHRSEGAPLERVLAEHLAGAGLLGKDAPCLVQCFDGDALVRLREEHGVQCPMVQLVEDVALGENELTEIAGRAEILGPPKSLVARDDGELVGRCHGHGLKVMPYTFLEDEAEYRRFFHDFGVDGVFSNFPHVALRCLNP